MRRLSEYVHVLNGAVGSTSQMSDTELNELRGALRAQCDAAEATNRAVREQTARVLADERSSSRR